MKKGDVLNSIGVFSESLGYDAHGNITSVTRKGKKSSSTYGTMDNLTLSYDGNRLAGVSESVADYDFAGSFEYKKANGSQYIYDANGSLVADKSRGIAYITYDANNNPATIYFTNGNVTKYSYSATGRKMRVEYYVAAPNTSVTFGVEPDALTQGQTMYAGSTDYLLGGSLVSKDSMTDRYLFEGGYAKASMVSPTNYRFNFLYYNQDHLGNNREVVDSAGTVKQVTNYYPFGAPYADPAAVLNASLQPYKYNGKELDRMHGLDTYDYGARQYNPVTAHWDRMDPLCEKYYSVSPYAYCANNPVRYIDQDGKSTKVKLLEDGTYQVIGGDINDKDRNIYVYTQDENDEYTIKGESIGVSATMTSFYNSDDKNPSNRWGGIINPKDNSGILFLNDIMVKNTPNLIEYMYYARNGEKYDFKVTNGTNSVIDGIDPQRGMPLTTNSKGEITYASARDIGNMAAGYIAARNGIPWKTARKAFDFYQGSPEGKTTVNAQLYGYTVLGHNTTAQILLRFLRNNKK